MSVQQGGIGLLLSTLIVMAPPMAAAFFQGTLGNFASYSSFGGIGAGAAMAQRQQALAQGRVPAAAPTDNQVTRESSQTSKPIGTFASAGQYGSSQDGRSGDVTKTLS